MFWASHSTCKEEDEVRLPYQRIILRLTVTHIIIIIIIIVIIIIIIIIILTRASGTEPLKHRDGDPQVKVLDLL